MFSQRILVVDDDPNIRQLIEAYLQKEGYETEGLGTAEEAETRWRKNPPDLLVLDIMLPGIDGYEFCRRIRKSSEIPIIMISARDEEVNKILGIELGSDDYLTKPFSPAELVARVKRQLYRWEMQKTNQAHNNGILSLPQKEDNKLHQIKAGKLMMNIEERRVFWDSNEVNVTEKEFLLIHHLATHLNRACAREELINDVWGFDYFGSDRTVDHVVKRLRKKMNGILLETVWGYGYRLRTDNVR